MDQLSRTFSALADPTRRAILARLATGAATVGDLAEPFDMSFAAAAKHVKVLETAGLLSRTVEGRTHRCRIEAGPLAEADRWIAHYQHFWTGRLDALESALLQHARKDTPLVALAFECQLFPEIPTASHDIFMDKLITEAAVYEGKGRS